VEAAKGGLFRRPMLGAGQLSSEVYTPAVEEEDYDVTCSTSGSPNFHEADCVKHLDSLPLSVANSPWWSGRCCFTGGYLSDLLCHTYVYV
jgi:hypothetical protein